MGAGWQRWWLDPDRAEFARRRWNEQQQATLSRAILRASRRELPAIRRVVEAFVNLWRM